MEQATLSRATKFHSKVRGVAGFFENLEHEIRVVADLGFLMRPFKSTFEKQIHDRIDSLIFAKEEKNKLEKEKKHKPSVQKDEKPEKDKKKTKQKND